MSDHEESSSADTRDGQDETPAPMAPPPKPKSKAKAQAPAEQDDAEPEAQAETPRSGAVRKEDYALLQAPKDGMSAIQYGILKASLAAPGTPEAPVLAMVRAPNPNVKRLATKEVFGPKLFGAYDKEVLQGTHGIKDARRRRNALIATYLVEGHYANDMIWWGVTTAPTADTVTDPQYFKPLSLRLLLAFVAAADIDAKGIGQNSKTVGAASILVQDPVTKKEFQYSRDMRLTIAKWYDNTRVPKTLTETPTTAPATTDPAPAKTKSAKSKSEKPKPKDELEATVPTEELPTVANDVLIQRLKSRRDKALAALPELLTQGVASGILPNDDLQTHLLHGQTMAEDKRQRMCAFPLDFRVPVSDLDALMHTSVACTTPWPTAPVVSALLVARSSVGGQYALQALLRWIIEQDATLASIDAKRHVDQFRQGPHTEADMTQLAAEITASHLAMKALRQYGDAAFFERSRPLQVVLALTNKILSYKRGVSLNFEAYCKATGQEVKSFHPVCALTGQTITNRKTVCDVLDLELDSTASPDVAQITVFIVNQCTTFPLLKSQDPPRPPVVAATAEPDSSSSDNNDDDEEEKPKAPPKTNGKRKREVDTDAAPDGPKAKKARKAGSTAPFTPFRAVHPALSAKKKEIYADASFGDFKAQVAAHPPDNDQMTQCITVLGELDDTEATFTTFGRAHPELRSAASALGDILRRYVKPAAPAPEPADDDDPFAVMSDAAAGGDTIPVKEVSEDDAPWDALDFLASLGDRAHRSLLKKDPSKAKAQEAESAEQAIKRNSWLAAAFVAVFAPIL